MVVATLLAVLTLLGDVEPWQVYVLAVLRGMVLVFDAPARQAFTYQMVGPAEPRTPLLSIRRSSTPPASSGRPSAA